MILEPFAGFYVSVVMQELGISGSEKTSSLLPRSMSGGGLYMQGFDVTENEMGFTAVRLHY